MQTTLIPVKVCTKCKTQKPHTSFGYRRAARDRLTSHCRDCRNRAKNAWHERHKDEQLAKARDWKAKNRDYVNTYAREYYAENIEVCRRKTRERNHKRYSTDDAYRRSMQEQNRVRYALDPEYRARLIMRAMRWINTPKGRLSKLKTSQMRRKSGGIEFDKDAWAAKLASLGAECVYCGSTENIHCDHATPLSRGGTHHIDNLQPACQSCNSSKANKTDKEYRRMISISGTRKQMSRGSLYG